ncbi:hypothetical protein KKF55_04470 [Patescibacteria group bacterium]|nr:hypothetical protein [Patescibacteria group bacterium]
MYKEVPPKTIEEKLDVIIDHLEAMDHRDRLRTIGGTIKGMISMIPIIILVGSMWYFYKYGDQLLEKIAQQAAKQAAIVTEQKGSAVIQKFEDLMGR